MSDRLLIEVERGELARVTILSSDPGGTALVVHTPDDFTDGRYAYRVPITEEVDDITESTAMTAADLADMEEENA